MMAKVCYIVYEGKVPGVYDEWYECQAQVEGSRAPAIKASKPDKKPKLVTCRFTLARDRTRNHRLMYCIVPLSLIVIALLAYTFV